MDESRFKLILLLLKKKQKKAKKAGVKKKQKKLTNVGLEIDSELIENNSLRYLQFCVKLEWF